MSDQENIKTLKEEMMKIVTEQCGVRYNYSVDDRIEAAKTYAILIAAEEHLPFKAYREILD